MLHAPSLNPNFADRTTVPPEPSPSSSTPVFGRAALAVLGSMVFLIMALTAVLVQTTWYSPESSFEAPIEASEPGSFAQR